MTYNEELRVKYIEFFEEMIFFYLLSSLMTFLVLYYKRNFNQNLLGVKLFGVILMLMDLFLFLIYEGCMFQMVRYMIRYYIIG